MQTQLADFIKNTTEGREADEILRKCVHCGFCTATCPTYQLLGDELDGPRGRIYLIKQLLEGQAVSAKTQLHLDRCLTCRACETTCPSGVQYSRLADIGRQLVEQRVARPASTRLVRWALRELVPRTGLFGAAMRAGRMVRGVLPQKLKDKVPEARPAGNWPTPRHVRRMIVLAGCVQPSMAPSINAAAARVLDAVGISLYEVGGAGCCGAVRFHLHDVEGARGEARRNIDAWWPAIAAGEVEAIVMTASGCGTQVKDYAHLLADDPAYARKAERIVSLMRDISEVVAAEAERLRAALTGGSAGAASAAPEGHVPAVAFHAPCTLQHGLGIRGVVESLLDACGHRLVPVRDAHLCCGSAGTYSILQPELSERLRERKVDGLTVAEPQVIATANIGCLTHLQAGTALPVRHWIELVDQRLSATRGV